MSFKKPLDKIYEGLRADIKKFFREHEKKLKLYGEASKKIEEKIRQEFDGPLYPDEADGISLSEIWNLRDNYRKELSRLCGRDALEEKEDLKMFGRAYRYLIRKLNL